MGTQRGEGLTVHGVVVGVSGSAEADAALDWALAEASSRRMPLTAILAWTGPRGVQPHEYQDLLDRRREDLLALLDAAVRRTGLTAVEVSAVVAEGDAAESLVAAAHDVEMLVLGRRRLGRFGRMVLGSVSFEVVEHATVPVTVVRADDGAASDDGAGHDGRIVVGVDTSGSSLLALHHAAEVAQRTGAILEAIHAWQITTLAPLPGTWGWAPPLDDYEAFAAKTLDNAIEAAGVTLPPELLVRSVVHKSAASALVEASTAASRLVVGARGLGGFDRLLLGSGSRQVLEYAACPVTVVR
jgi:nucleotide-binding universal stress UspA family protein